MNDHPIIYRYEAKSIQKYVLASDRLKEIKGASALVEDLERRLDDALEAQGNVGRRCYAAAGGATVTFPDRQSAEDFRAHWPIIVAQHAPGLQVSQAIIDGGDLAADTEHTLMDHLAQAIERDRAHAFADLPEAGPLAHRAPRSGLPAIYPDRELRDLAKQGETLFDKASAAGLRAAKEESRDPLAERVLKDWPAPDEYKPTFVDDTDNLKARYVAVVCADGNDIGQLLRKVVPKGTPPAKAVAMLETFSNRLSDATRRSVGQAVYDAWNEAMLQRDTWPYFPGRPIVVGGDDVTFLLRSDLAIPFARAYLKHFQDNTHDVAQDHAEQLTACAGIAFVHQNYPFHLALDLAESLCKFTKNAMRDPVGRQTPSALHFHRVTASMSDRYEDIVIQELTVVTSDGNKRVLTMGPYALEEGSHGAATVAQICALRDTIAAPTDPSTGRREIRTVPRGALNDVLTLITEGRISAANSRFKRIRETMCDPTQPVRVRQAWEKFEEALRATGVEENGYWRSWEYNGRKVSDTPLADVLDFIPVSMARAKGS